MIIGTANSAFQNFWLGITPDGIIQAAATVLTIIGAFIVAWCTSRQNIKLYQEDRKEDGKKIFLTLNDAHSKINTQIKEFLKNYKNSVEDIEKNKFTISLEFSKIKKSDIETKSPSDIKDTLNKFVIYTEGLMSYIKHILVILNMFEAKNMEEFLEKSNDDYKELINEHLNESRELANEIDNLTKNIIKYYK